MIDLATFHPKLRNYHVTTFEKLASFPFGGLGKSMVLLSMFIMGYGAMVAYLMIIKDTVPTILGFEHGVNAGVEREIVLVITSALVMLPLSMQRVSVCVSSRAASTYVSSLSVVFYR
jgi:sodium-coupled neutral amino acid transporter 11